MENMPWSKLGPLPEEATGTAGAMTLPEEVTGPLPEEAIYWSQLELPDRCLEYSKKLSILQAPRFMSIYIYIYI